MITVLVDGLFSLITVVLLFLYSPFLTWIVLGFVLVFTMLRVAAIPIEKNRRQETLVTNAKQQSRFMENIKSISVTKINGIERERESDWQGVYADFINSGYQLGRFQLGVASLQGLIFGLDHIVTIYFASVMVHTGALTLGQMMSFIFLKQHFSNSIAAMLPKLAELRLMKLELERVADIALQEPENLTPLPLLFGSQLVGKIEARELSFSYPNNEHRVFHELNFLIDPGSCVAITGKSGCGKSTLLKIILGLEKPDSGKIVFDDRDQASIGVTALRDQVSAIMHSDQLLSGDIAYNINLGTEPYNEQRLKRACDRAGIFEAICKLPMNFRTQVGEMGSIFSAGQVQRLLLARALYRLPRILVLDEALSHLGNDTSKSLLQSISGLGITVLLVTHNPELVKVATHIIRLE
jgi:ATP-binding cassette subfamily B protein RaxB